MMTEEKVKECYIEKKMSLIDTAKELHVNLTVLHNFIVTHNLVRIRRLLINLNPEEWESVSNRGKANYRRIYKYRFNDVDNCSCID